MVRRRIEANAKRRVIAATRAREIKEEQERKVKLLNEKRKKVYFPYTQFIPSLTSSQVIDKIKMTTRFRAAAKIQRRWRLHSAETKKKKESELNKKNMMLKMAEEVDEEKRRKQIKFPKLKLPRLPNPVHVAQNAMRAVDSLFNDDADIQHHEQPKYMLSVLKYQTQSIRQVGIIDIAFTYGEGEETAFEQRQQFNKSTRRRYFEKVLSPAHSSSLYVAVGRRSFWVFTVGDNSMGDERHWNGVHLSIESERKTEKFFCSFADEPMQEFASERCQFSVA